MKKSYTIFDREHSRIRVVARAEIINQNFAFRYQVQIWSERARQWKSVKPENSVGLCSPEELGKIKDYLRKRIAKIIINKNNNKPKFKKDA